MCWEVQSPKDHHWWYVVNTPIRHPDGSMSKMAMIQDVTAHKRTEQALQEAEAKYRGICENAVIGIFQSTPAGRLLSVNPALARMHGYDTPEEMVAGIADMGHQIFVDPEQRLAFRRELEESGVIRDREYQVYRRGRRHFLGGGKRPGGAGRHRRHQLLRGVYPGHHRTEKRPGMWMTGLIAPRRF